MIFPILTLLQFFIILFILNENSHAKHNISHSHNESPPHVSDSPWNYCDYRDVVVTSMYYQIITNKGGYEKNMTMSYDEKVRKGFEIYLSYFQNSLLINASYVFYYEDPSIYNELVQIRNASYGKITVSFMYVYFYLLLK